MIPLFADTSFYIAIVSVRDIAHAKAIAAARAHHGSTVTTEYVLLEVANWLSRADDKPVFLDLHAQLKADPASDIVPVDSAIRDRGLALYETRRDKDWSLTDCVSFIVMRERGLDQALTSDHHFEQAGFTILLK